jgi:hypothetical protein
VTGIWSVLFPSLRGIEQLTAESLLQEEEQPYPG